MSYLLLGVPFLVLAALPRLLLAAWHPRRPHPTATSPASPTATPHRRSAATLVTFAVLIALTVVFDSLMISAGLFTYAEQTLTGWRIWRAPVEDLAWPVAAALGLPALWDLLAGRRLAAQQPTGRQEELVR